MEDDKYSLLRFRLRDIPGLRPCDPSDTLLSADVHKMAANSI